MNRINRFGDLEPRMSYDSSKKRKRKQIVIRSLLTLIAIAVVAFLSVRITKLTACAEEGGFFASTDCGGISQCCEVVTPVVSHNKVTFK